jgi:hypothetical protein
MQMKPSFKQLLLTTAIAATVAPIATAQDNPFLRGRYVDVTTRSQPDFDPQPIRSGAFVITSSLGVSGEYNDNVFAEPDNEDDDTILRVTPRVDARSDWTVHELALGGWVNHREHMDFDTENTTDYNLFGQGRIDVSRDFQVTLGADYGHFTEDRYAAGSFAASEPASFDRGEVYARALYRNDRIQLQGTVGTSSEDYDQAVQDFRDNDTSYVSGRVSYAISPDVAVFVQARQADLDYSQSNRDGTQTTIDAGVNFELSAPFSGEIAVGQFKDDRDDPTFGDSDGLNVAGNLKWFPTELTTVTFLANRGVFDPGLAASATAVNTGFGVRIDHELLRNVLLFGNVRQETSEYEGTVIDREDDALSLAVGGAYKMNRNMHLEFQLSTRAQDSSGAQAGPEADVNIVSAGIRFFP